MQRGITPNGMRGPVDLGLAVNCREREKDSLGLPAKGQCGPRLRVRLAARGGVALEGQTLTLTCAKSSTRPRSTTQLGVGYARPPAK